MDSIELERARHVNGKLVGLGFKELEAYADRLKGAPAELMDNGLLQMLAFYLSKDGPQKRIAKDVLAWLSEARLLEFRQPSDAPVAMAKLDAARYRRCSEEAMAWLSWAKRLAAARVATTAPVPGSSGEKT